MRIARLSYRFVLELIRACAIAPALGYTIAPFKRSTFEVKLDLGTDGEAEGMW